MVGVKSKKDANSSKKGPQASQSEPSTTDQRIIRRSRRRGGGDVDSNDSGLEVTSKRNPKRREDSPKVTSPPKKSRQTSKAANDEDEAQIVEDVKSTRPQPAPQRKVATNKRRLPHIKESVSNAEPTGENISKKKTSRKMVQVKNESENNEATEERMEAPTKRSSRYRQSQKQLKIEEEEDEEFTDELDDDYQPEKKVRRGNTKKVKEEPLPESDTSDSEGEVPVKRTRVAQRAPKKRILAKKSFMKPRKVIKASDSMINKENSKCSQVTSSSVREQRLLLLARQMDDKTNTADEGKPSSDSLHSAGTSSENGISEKAKSDFILGMLKQHEQVDEMTDDSDDDDEEEEVKDSSKGMKVQAIGENKETKSAITSKPEDDKVKKASSKQSQQTVKDHRSKGSTNEKKTKKQKGKKITKEEKSSSEDGEDEDWEVVENAAVRDPNYQRPEKVTVVLKHEDFISDSKRTSMEQQIMRFLNRRRKEVQLLCHNTHMLALLAYQRYLNSVIENDLLKALALSSMPANMVLGQPKSRKNGPDNRLVQSILLYCKQEFEITEPACEQEETFSMKFLKQKLRLFIKKRKTSCNIVYLLGIILTLRAIGVLTRLCLSHRPVSHKTALLRQKDGEMVEVGAKRPAVETVGVLDYFAEVYLSDRRCWRAVDLEEHKMIDNPHELGEHLDQPLVYVVGIDGTGAMKDLTPKYHSSWLSKGIKLRPNKFFENTLALFAPDEDDEGHIEEQKEVATLHEKQGLPKTIGEYKNHPKYALTRHLLKFEAFYPPNPEILGYINKEPVHPRECVKVLHSKDQWHRFAREVREGEQAYKLVKARPKWDRKNDCLIRDLPPLEVFGEWQTDPYKPPVIVDGKIPRNRFGNVELFHPDMMPVGGVHLKLPGLNRIAQELGFDCVPAVIGFDGVQRGLHPVYEGFIVCAEHKEALEAAWHEIQNEGRQKRRERIRKRAVKNWKTLIRKVMWDNHLKKKYKHNLQ